MRPDFILPVLIVLAGIGFPVVLVLAWAFDVTPSGIEKTPEAIGTAARANRRNAWLLGTAGLLIAALAVGGYWLWHPWKIAAQTKATGAAPPSEISAPTNPALREKSIAVLPFENLSANQENAFFTDGVQNEILANLAKVADLKVISRTSVMLYKSANPRNLREIAEQLGVAHVLEGSVQRSANRVRVTAQLIDARSDAHLWAQTYDRDLADVFAIQSEIAK
jgi:TolB-like protein